MAGICESIIAKSIEANCENPLVKGMEADGVIINRNDIDFSQSVFDTDSKNIIKQLILKTGKKGYSVVQMGATPYTGLKTNLATGKYRNTFNNEIPIAVLDNSPEVHSFLCCVMLTRARMARRSIRCTATIRACTLRRS